MFFFINIIWIVFILIYIPLNLMYLGHIDVENLILYKSKVICTQYEQCIVGGMWKTTPNKERKNTIPSGLAFGLGSPASCIKSKANCMLCTCEKKRNENKNINAQFWFSISGSEGYRVLKIVFYVFSLFKFTINIRFVSRNMSSTSKYLFHL